MKETVVSVKKLTKCYQTHYALKEIDLSIKEGEVFGIIGMSGSGKSTLIRCLTGLERPSDGTIILSNDEMTSFSGEALRRARKKFGMIFQHFNLFSSRTVLDNICYPLEIEGIFREKREKRAHELLHLVGLKGKEHSYPAQLSGGEKQRVAIARALAGRPKILFCDEATSALDPSTTRSILDLLSKLNQTLGLTILIITHEMEVVKRICTQVAVLEHGEIVEQGRVEELFAKPKHPTTQRFLQHLTHEVPEHLRSNQPHTVLLRLSFSGGSAEKPIISQLIRQFDVEVNILMGGIDILRRETIGNLVIELSGGAKERALARAFLEEQGVGCDELV